MSIPWDYTNLLAIATPPGLHYLDGMQRDFSVPLSLSTVPIARRIEALGRLWPHFDESSLQSLLASYERPAELFGPSFWNGLVGSFRGEHLTGVAWAEPQAGRVAAIHGPRLVAKENSTTAVNLLKLAIEQTCSQPVRLIQTLRRTDEEIESQALVKLGFRHVANLLYMQGDLPASLKLGPSMSLIWESYSAEKHDRFAAIIERTYINSLDCPAVDGLRAMTDVLDGYRATGAFDPDRWLLVSARLTPQESLVDVGCVLLAEQPLTEQWELMYMGIVPEARGRGWGLEIVRCAQSLARSKGARSMVLAVDAANAPGVRMYEAAGFRVFDRRELFVAEVSPMGGFRRPPQA